MSHQKGPVECQETSEWGDTVKLCSSVGSVNMEDRKSSSG